MRTLLVGNTGYITNEFIEEAFPESLVMLLGDTTVKTNRRKNLLVRPFTQSEEELEDLFHTYEFEQVVYFSNYLSFHGELQGEADMLRRVLQCCRKKRQIRIIYLTGPENNYDTLTGKHFLFLKWKDWEENWQSFMRSESRSSGHLIYIRSSMKKTF
ncbi:MAG: hypothetical protein ACLR6B_15270 [Blautia sp.]